MMKSNLSPDYPEQVEKQLGRLVHLEEALLLLSRLDAGALPLEKNQVDVFTVLTLAARQSAGDVLGVGGGGRHP